MIKFKGDLEELRVFARAVLGEQASTSQVAIGDVRNLIAAVRRGGPIDAIKAIRNILGCSLKDANNLYEEGK